MRPDVFHHAHHLEAQGVAQDRLPYGVLAAESLLGKPFRHDGLVYVGQDSLRRTSRQPIIEELQEVGIHSQNFGVKELAIYDSTLRSIIGTITGPFLNLGDGGEELLCRTCRHAEIIARTYCIKFLRQLVVRPHPILHTGVRHQNNHKSQGYREPESLDSRIKLVAREKFKITFHTFIYFFAKVRIPSLSAKKTERARGGLYEIHTLFCMIIIHQGANHWAFREKCVLLQTDRSTI